MNFVLSRDQFALQGRLREFLTERVPESETRALMETASGYSDATWRELAQLTGIVGKGPLDDGAGVSLVDTAAAAEVLGESLYGGPYLSTHVLAGELLRLLPAGGSAQELLDKTGSGQAVLAVAFADSDDAALPPVPAVQAAVDGPRATVSGRASYVIDGHTADELVVLAEGPQGLVIVSVSAEQPGVVRTLRPTLDMTRKQADIALDAATGTVLSDAGVADLWSTWFHRVQVVVAAEQVGGGLRSLVLAVDYAKERHQFGHPIGSFQAIKHKCAERLADLESARSAVYYAAWVADHQPDELPVMAALAKTVASESYYQAAADCLQIHGGVGFTWADPAHLYLKRAKSTGLLFGDAGRSRARIADLIGL